MYFCADKSTKNSRQELLARTPLHRLIITKGLRSYCTHSRIILSVMIAPLEPSISLRSWLANNSKGRCSLKLFLKNRGLLETGRFLSANYLTSTISSATRNLSICSKEIFRFLPLVEMTRAPILLVRAS